MTTFTWSFAAPPGHVRAVVIRSLSARWLLEDGRMRLQWSLRPATNDDAQWIADLKLVAMRPDMERLGYWHPEWARKRFLDAYVPAHTQVAVLDGKPVGSIAVRPEPDALWIEHFYLHPDLQGRGLGGRILAHVLAAYPDQRPFMLEVVKGSAARRLYERHGFVHRYDADNGVDQIFSLDR